MTDFKQALIDCAEQVEEALGELIPEMEGYDGRLAEAMRYGCLGGGKRLRPFLALTSARLFGVSEESAIRTAAAIEMVHCYSLVHDDLPAMDNDDMRRGRPTSHIEFDEATAILAGDALLTKAFEVLSSPETHDAPQVRSELVLAFSKAAGDHGMVGGQMLDLLAETRTLDVPGITRLQRMKTGALISVAAESGAILGRASTQARHALRGYAHDIGLAFQIADDILDVEGDAEVVGKKTGKDIDAGKETFVSLLGLENAREQANILSRQASEHLVMFEGKADLLRDLASFMVSRDN